MTNLEIKINGAVVSLASLNSKHGVITAIITTSRKLNESEDSNNLYISGVDSDAGNRLEWGEYSLLPGDEVIVKLTEDAVVTDAPTTLTSEMVEKRNLENKLKTFYQLKKELKDHIK